MFAKTSRWIAYPLAWLLLMVAPMLIDAWAASAGPVSEVNQFTIPSFKAHYQARRSDQGLALDVTETITASFPRRNTNRGIERRLDTRYGGTDIELSGFQVTDPSGKRIPFTQRTESDGDIVLRIGRANSYVFGRVDYVVRYTIGQAMVQADDRQEIYLDVNGTGSAAAVRSGAGHCGHPVRPGRQPARRAGVLPRGGGFHPDLPDRAKWRHIRRGGARP